MERGRIEIQPKVSIIVPCYNKERYIADTLASFHGQSYDNIELILVNDGSTDGTREIITLWEPRFRQRNYDIRIIDQENQGRAAAVRNGIAAATGVYFCQFDSDDIMKPHYVAEMANWLEAHPDYSWVQCEAEWLDMNLPPDRRVDGSIAFGAQSGCSTGADRIVHYLFDSVEHTTISYMVRASYASACGLVEHFVTDRNTSQEPSFQMLLAGGGGKIGRIHSKLHIYRTNVGGVSERGGYADYVAYEKTRCAKVRLLTDKLALLDGERKVLRLAAQLALLRRHYLLALQFRQPPGQCSAIMEEAFVLAENGLGLACEPTADTGDEGAMRLFWRAVEQGLIRAMPSHYSGRTIAVGALGKAGTLLLPALRGTVLEPHLLWDRSAEPGSTMCSLPVEKPAYGTLHYNDTVLVLPRYSSFRDELRPYLEAAEVQTVLYYEQIEAFLAQARYPALFSGGGQACGKAPSPGRRVCALPEGGGGA